MKIIHFVTGLALISATTAKAETRFQNGVTLDGYIELGQVHTLNSNNGDHNQSLLRADIDLSYRPAPTGYCITLGIDGYGGSIGQEVAVHPALEYSTSLGTVSLGAPRSVVDRGYLPSFTLGNSSYASLEYYSLYRSAVSIFNLEHSNIPYGLRYDGALGQTKIGFSAHKLNNRRSGSIRGDSYSLALSRHIDTKTLLGRLHLSAARERVNYDNGVYHTGHHLGVETVNGPTTLGVLYKEEGVAFQYQTLVAYVNYTFKDNLKLTASFGRLDNPFSSLHSFLAAFNYYGLGLEYTLKSNAYLKASFTDASNNLNGPSGEIMMGWKF